MCGISGYFKLNGNKDFDVLAHAMREVQRHRGPDHFGSYRDDDLMLGHNRLSIIDISEHGHQPFQDDRYVLIFSGEIYNYKKLKPRLDALGIVFQGTSDTEVVFHHLVRFGVSETVRALRGMFAFAFYDRQTKQLALVRDRFGIKPMFYTQRPEGFAFASELKMFPHFFAVELDGMRVFNALHGYSEALNRFTLYRDVFALMPGHFLIFDGRTGRVQDEAYYRVLDDIDPALYRELDRMPPGEIVRRLGALLRDSVESMLMSDVPVGAFLSGGLDSSLISVIALELNPQIEFFTADVVGRYSELRYAQQVADLMSSPLHVHRHDGADFLARWAFSTWHYDFPIVTHTNSVPFAGVAAMAHARQVKVVLTGEGSDELFLGYPSIYLDEYRPLVNLPVRFLKALYGLSPMVREVVFPEQRYADLVHKVDLMEAFEQRERARELADRCAGLSSRERRYLGTCVLYLNRHLRSLLHRNDRLGMSASLESRFPFLDEDLVKFAINLPVKFKGRYGPRVIDIKHPFLTDKWALRELGRPKLPARIVQRSKLGFPVTIYRSLRASADFFRDSYLQELMQLDTAAVQALAASDDQYFVARLAAINVFGELFGRGRGVEEMTAHVQRTVTLTSNSLD